MRECEEAEMNTYTIEFKNRMDEFSEHHRFYVEAFDSDDAINRFRSLSSKQETQIVEVAKVLKKDFSKY